MSENTKARLLYETETTFVQQEGREIELCHYGPWTARLTRLAEKHRINALHIREIHGPKWPSLKFLFDLPPLRKLEIVVAHPSDLSPIGQLANLEVLLLMGEVPPSRGELSTLKKLKEAYVEMGGPSLGLLRCATLEKLWAWNNYEYKPWHRQLDLSALVKLRELHVTAWGSLTSLDLSHQLKLQELHIEAIQKLMSLTLHPRARIRKLHVGNCGAYRIDWKRLGPDLHDLKVAGPLRFPLTDVLKAPNLRALQTNAVRTFPPLKFLLKLKHLKLVDFFSISDPRFSAADRKVIETINDR